MFPALFLVQVPCLLMCNLRACHVFQAVFSPPKGFLAQTKKRREKRGRAARSLTCTRQSCLAAKKGKYNV